VDRRRCITALIIIEEGASGTRAENSMGDWSVSSGPDIGESWMEMFSRSRKKRRRKQKGRLLKPACFSVSLAAEVH